MSRPVITNCSRCGEFFADMDRYRVYLIFRKGILQGVRFKKLHLCRKCLEELKKDKEVRKRFKIRYRKMWYKPLLI